MQDNNNIVLIINIYTTLKHIHTPMHINTQTSTSPSAYILLCRSADDCNFDDGSVLADLPRRLPRHGLLLVDILVLSTCVCVCT